MTEHPFAQFIRIIGKGPRLSRPLTLDEARTAAAMVLAGEVEPVQLGAFLCLLRVRTETPEEVAGFALAIRQGLQLPPEMPRPDLDWPSYAGKARQLPLFILAALLLAANGVRIAMHGGEGHTTGRLYASGALAALGMSPATSWTEAAGQLRAANFTYVPLELIHPRLADIMGLKPLLGVRSPLHTVIRNVNPMGAGASLMSVFHPNYRAVHVEAARLLGDATLACFKGEGGEAERRPEKPCMVEGLLGRAAYGEEWPPLLDAGPGFDTAMDASRLPALWRGDAADPHAETTIAATAAVALRLCGRAGSIAEAEALAARLWAERRRHTPPVPAAYA